VSGKNIIKYFSNITRARQLQVSIAQNAVWAAAQVVRTQARLNVRPPFAVHGRYNKGNLRRSIRIRVIREGMRVWAEVGTMLEHGRHWELGYHPGGIGVFYRSEWLGPAFRSTVGEQQAAALKATRATVMSKRALFRFRV
jgi:hypothetical protein